MSTKRLVFSFACILLCFCLSLTSCGIIIFEDDKTEINDTSHAADSEVAEGSDTESTQSDDSDISIEEKPESAADRARKRVKELSEIDLKGQSFIIATTSNMTFATDGDSYYDRVLLLRDSIVEEKYNVDIITVFSDESMIETDLRNAALSGQYYADLLSLPEYKIGRLAKEGLIMNLRSLPFYGTTASYSRFWGEAAAGNAIYADIGAASADFSKIYAVFFNRDISEKMGFDLDKMVDDGEWTWDTFDCLSRAANEEFGVFGHGSAAMGDELTDIVFRSSGERLVDNTLGSVPRISFDSQKLEELIELTCALIYGNPAAYKRSATATESDFYKAFGSSRMLFAFAPLSKMNSFSVLDSNWGILPIPKAEEGQKHYFAYTEATANVLAVPSNNNKADITGIMIGALNTASYELLAEEYKTNCLYNYFGSIKAMRSMDEVLSSMTFDFSFIYASGAKSLAVATYGAVREARKSVSDYATDLINARSEAANRELRQLFGEKVIEDVSSPPLKGDEEQEDVSASEESTEAAS